MGGSINSSKTLGPWPFPSQLLATVVLTPLLLRPRPRGRSPLPLAFCSWLFISCSVSLRDDSDMYKTNFNSQDFLNDL